MKTVESLTAQWDVQGGILPQIKVFNSRLSIHNKIISKAPRNCWLKRQSFTKGKLSG